MSNYIDRETLALARIVAKAEGISLQQAIIDQIELAILEGVAE